MDLGQLGLQAGHHVLEACKLGGVACLGLCQGALQRRFLVGRREGRRSCKWVSFGLLKCMFIACITAGARKSIVYVKTCCIHKACQVWLCALHLQLNKSLILCRLLLQKTAWSDFLWWAHVQAERGKENVHHLTSLVHVGVPCSNGTAVRSAASGGCSSAPWSLSELSPGSLCLWSHPAPLLRSRWIKKTQCYIFYHTAL